MKLTHPKCGKTFPDGSRSGHCSGCCETFIGLGAFEQHRDGDHAVRRFCKTLTDGEGGFWLDDRGYWHHGEKLTEEQKASMWGKAAESESDTQ